MAEPKIIPHTEDDLYIVPAKKAAPPPAKVVSMDAGGKVAEPVAMLTPFAPKVDKSFFEKNKTVLIISGIVVISLVIYAYHQHCKRKAQEAETKPQSPINKYRPGLS